MATIVTENLLVNSNFGGALTKVASFESLISISSLDLIGVFTSANKLYLLDIPYCKLGVGIGLHLQFSSDGGATFSSVAKGSAITSTDTLGANSNPPKSQDAGERMFMINRAGTPFDNAGHMFIHNPADDTRVTVRSGYSHGDGGELTTSKVYSQLNGAYTIPQTGGFDSLRIFGNGGNIAEISGTLYKYQD